MRVAQRKHVVFVKKMNGTSGNNFHEMKGDVVMSLHEKGNKTPDKNSFITPSLHLCFFQDHNVFHRHLDVKLFFSLPNVFSKYFKTEQR